MCDRLDTPVLDRPLGLLGGHRGIALPNRSLSEKWHGNENNRYEEEMMECWDDRGRRLHHFISSSLHPFIPSSPYLLGQLP
jgi:hypothetical protein